MPGQEGIPLAKKSGSSSLPNPGFGRFQPSYPFPPRFSAETKKEGNKEVFSRPVLLFAGDNPALKNYNEKAWKD